MNRGNGIAGVAQDQPTRLGQYGHLIDRNRNRRSEQIRYYK